jgi:hypothetical protein
MKKLHKLIQYALNVMETLQIEPNQCKQQAFAVVRYRLEDKRYIK